MSANDTLASMTDLLAVSDAARAEAFAYLTQLQMDCSARDRDGGDLFHALLCAVHVLSDEASFQRERADRFEAFAAGVEGRLARLERERESFTDGMEPLPSRPALVHDWQGC